MGRYHLKEFDDDELLMEIEKRGFTAYAIPNILNQDLFERLEKLLTHKEYHEVDSLLKSIEP